MRRLIKSLALVFLYGISGPLLAAIVPFARFAAFLILIATRIERGIYGSPFFRCGDCGKRQFYFERHEIGPLWHPRKRVCRKCYDNDCPF